VVGLRGEVVVGPLREAAPHKLCSKITWRLRDVGCSTITSV
jgi:hypothetical protein